MTKKTFPLGATVVTAAVDRWVREDATRSLLVAGLLSRHATGDWGDLSAEDRKANDAALKDGDGRLFSSYKVDGPGESKVWIITEWDRSVTTVLWPSDY